MFVVVRGCRVTSQLSALSCVKAGRSGVSERGVTGHLHLCCKPILGSEVYLGSVVFSTAPHMDVDGGAFLSRLPTPIAVRLTSSVTPFSITPAPACASAICGSHTYMPCVFAPHARNIDIKCKMIRSAHVNAHTLGASTPREVLTSDDEHLSPTLPWHVELQHLAVLGANEHLGLILFHQLLKLLKHQFRMRKMNI